MLRRSHKTVSPTRKPPLKIFPVVKKQTTYGQKMRDGDRLQLCELYGPQASQLPTLNIFPPLQGPVYQNNIAER